MYCGRCGTEIQDGIRFCPNCGQEQAPAGAAQEPNYQPYQQPRNQGYGSQGYQSQGYQNQGYQTQGYQNRQYTNAPQQTNGLAIAALVLGIAAIIFMFIFSPVGLILAIIGIVLGSKGRRIEYMRGMATAGWVLSIIALILCIIAVIAMIALFAFGASFVGSILGSLY